MAPLAKMVARGEMVAVEEQGQQLHLLSAFVCLRWGRLPLPVQGQAEAVVVALSGMRAGTEVIAPLWVTERAADRVRGQGGALAVQRVPFVLRDLLAGAPVPVRKYLFQGCLQPVAGMELTERMAKMVEMGRMVRLVSW